MISLACGMHISCLPKSIHLFIALRLPHFPLAIQKNKMVPSHKFLWDQEIWSNPLLEEEFMLLYTYHKRKKQSFQ